MNKEMNYEEFMKLLMAELKGRIEDGCNLSMNDIPVINGNVKHSLTISRKDKDIAPCICMDGFYRDYVNGYMNMVEIAEMTTSIYKQEAEHDDPDTDVLKNWESARKMIRFRLVNTKMNMDMLKTMAHREFLDLSLVYYVHISIPDDMDGMAHIHNGFLGYWNVDEEELYRAAMANMQNSKDAEIRTMGDMIGVLADGQKAAAVDDICDMYVLTNRSGLYASAYMLDMEMMKKTADKLDSDLWILPSSIHELILIPRLDVYDVQDIAGMVKEVNGTELQADEILSYHVYQYSRETGKISIAA